MTNNTPPDPAVLRELIERVEAASGPSLVLDRDIALAVYPGATAVAQCDARFSVWDGNGRTQLTVKPYTASLDAAMTLVPEGWRIQLSDWDDETLRAHGPWQCILTPPGKRGTFDEWWPRCDHAASAPLALCAAALRAHTSTPTMVENGDG